MIGYVLGGVAVVGFALFAGGGDGADGADDGPAGPEPEELGESGYTDAELADMDNGSDAELDPPSPPPGVPPNYRVLDSAADLQSSRLLAAVEGEPSSPKTVFVGMDPGWTRRPDAVTELRRLAIEWPQVNVRAFSFERTRELVGQPPASPYMAYLAVAVDLSGQPGPVLTADTRGAELGRQTLANLFALALGSVLDEQPEDDAELPASAVLREVRRPGDPPTLKHIVLLTPRPVGWAWQVWRGKRAGEPIGLGTGSTRAKALAAAEHFVQWYQPGPRLSGELRLG